MTFEVRPVTEGQRGILAWRRQDFRHDLAPGGFALARGFDAADHWVRSAAPARLRAGS